MFEPLALPYEYDALEPHIDAETMHVHHEKHYGGYTAKLNAALEPHAELQAKSIEDLLSGLNELPEDVKTAVRNNGGGYFNHGLFWQIMSPEASGQPTDEIAEAIEESFDTFEEFQAEFAAAAAGIFGSGWAWLIKDPSGELEITTTPNQDNPLMS